MNLYFSCHWCGEALSGETEQAGKTVPCPECGTLVLVPRQRSPLFVEESEREHSTPLEESETTSDCPMCGDQVQGAHSQCPSCGEIVSPLARLRAGMSSHIELIRKFRQEVHALGAFWIFIGIVSSLVGGVGFWLMLQNPQQATRYLPNFALASGGAVLFFGGLFSVLLGLCTLLKQSWALHLGIGYSYLHLVFSVFTLNVVGAGIYIIVILQARRVMRYARSLEEAGYPMNTRISEFTS